MKTLPCDIKFTAYALLAQKANFITSPRWGVTNIVCKLNRSSAVPASWLSNSLCCLHLWPAQPFPPLELHVLISSLPAFHHIKNHIKNFNYYFPGRVIACDSSKAFEHKAFPTFVWYLGCLHNSWRQMKVVFPCKYVRQKNNFEIKLRVRFRSDFRS